MATQKTETFPHIPLKMFKNSSLFYCRRFFCYRSLYGHLPGYFPFLPFCLSKKKSAFFKCRLLLLLKNPSPLFFAAPALVFFWSGSGSWFFLSRLQGAQTPGSCSPALRPNTHVVIKLH